MLAATTANMEAEFVNARIETPFERPEQGRSISWMIVSAVATPTSSVGRRTHQ